MEHACDNQCAILYVVYTGCQWRTLTHEYPPWQTAYYHFRKWQNDAPWFLVYEALHRDRRLTMDYERYATTAETMVYIAIIRLMLKRKACFSNKFLGKMFPGILREFDKILILKINLL